MRLRSCFLSALVFMIAPTAVSEQVHAEEAVGKVSASSDGRDYEVVCQFVDSIAVPNSENRTLTTSAERLLSVNGADIVIKPLANIPSSPPPGNLSPGKSKKAELSSLRGLSEVSAVGLSKEELYQITKSLEASGQVRYCDFIRKNIPPPADISPVTPDLSNFQDYLLPAAGLDIAYARSLGLTGENIVIADVEYDWDLFHEDLASQAVAFGNSRGLSDYYIDHGTAVAGVFISGDNGYGMTGTIPDASMLVFSEQSGRVQAIVDAVAALAAGDVLVLEMQAGGDGGKYVPADYDISVWNVIQLATAAGIHVVAAAGNGDADLDGTAYDSYRARGDNGSIIVGAGSSTESHDKRYFSTYGSPVDVQGWGENVATLGSGDLARYGSDPHQEYTAVFNGTSSATTIVASAVALVQEYAEVYLGRDIAPVEMRNLLISTGIAQGTGGHIGPFPDIRSALNSLQGGSSSSSSSGGGGALASCEYILDDEWNTGFVATVRLTNISRSVISTWDVSWAYASSVPELSAWNATLSGTNPYNALPLAWSSQIQPGQFVEIGLLGVKDITGAPAEIPLVSGSKCQ